MRFFLWRALPNLDFIIDGEVVKTVRTRGQKVEEFPEWPEKEGHYFEGWFYLDGEEEKPFNISTEVKQNIQVFAKLTPKQVITVAQPTYEGLPLRYGDGLPHITTITEGGNIWLDEGQELKVGTHEYTWTFVPDDVDHYIWQNTKGTILLTVYKGIREIPQGIEISAAQITSNLIILALALF